MLLERLLRLAALTASGVELPACCQFELSVIAALCRRHSAGTLANTKAFSRMQRRQMRYIWILNSF